MVRKKYSKAAVSFIKKRLRLPFCFCSQGFSLDGYVALASMTICLFTRCFPSCMKAG